MYSTLTVMHWLQYTCRMLPTTSHPLCSHIYMEWTKHFQTPLHIMPYHWTDSGGQQVEHLLEYGSEAQFGGTCTFTQPTHQSEMLAVTTDMSTFILVICYSPHWCFIQKVSYHSGGVYDPTVIYQEAEAGVSKLQARRLRSDAAAVPDSISTFTSGHLLFLR